MAETSISASPIGAETAPQEAAAAAVNGHAPEPPEAPPAAAPPVADPLADEAVLRAERIAFLSLASELARERDVLVIDDGASALAGVAAHLDSLPVGELATAQAGVYDLVVADLTDGGPATLNGVAQLARVARPESGLTLVRMPNTDEFKPVVAAVTGSFANHRTLRQHNWVASALFDDAAFAWDNPSQAAVASLRKLAGANAGEELYTLILAGNGELPATVPHLAITRSAAMRELVEQLHDERDRAAAEIAALKAEGAAQAERIRELDAQLAWFDEHELNLRESIEKRGWAMSLLNFWARSVAIARRAKNALRS